jgi:hypothetical protein
LVLVVTIVSVFVYFQFGNPYGSGGLAIDWRLTLKIYDYRPPGANYTLPSGIGAPGGIRSSNHTLDSLGPPGYAPLSTRDATGTIWIQSNQITIFTFGDLFNIWGQTISRTCVSDTNVPQIGTYCTAPAEPVVYDADNNGLYDPAADKLLPVISQLTVHTPPSGARLSSDPRLKYYDQDGNRVYDTNTDTVVYDVNNNGQYDPGVDIIVAGSVVPPAGQPLRTDSRIMFFDENSNGHWDQFVPPPILYDHGKDQVRCVSRDLALSNGKFWTIFLWYPNTANEIQGGCLP